MPNPTIPDGTILFDGVCVLCSAAFRFVARRDPTIQFRFLALQTPVGREMAHTLGIDPEAPLSNALMLGGRLLVRSEATIEILRRLPGWRWAGLLRIVPLPVRDRLYNLVARHRYRLFGRTDTCMLPDAQLRAHMLEIPS